MSSSKTLKIEQLTERVAQLEEIVKALQNAQKEATPVASESGEKKARTRMQRNEQGQVVCKNGQVRKANSPSGWLTYCKANREIAHQALVRERLANLDETKILPKHVQQKLGELWKGLSEEEKLFWKKEAAQSVSPATVAAKDDSETGDEHSGDESD